MLTFIIVILHILAIPVFLMCVAGLFFPSDTGTYPMLPQLFISAFIVLFVSRQHFNALRDFVKKEINVSKYFGQLVSSVIKKIGWFFITFFMLGLFSMAGSKTDTKYGGWIVIGSLVLYLLTNWIHKKFFHDEIMD